MGRWRTAYSTVGGLLLAGWIGAGGAVADEKGAGFRGHGGAVRAVVALPADATHGPGLASGGFDSTIIVWDVQSGAARRLLRHHDSTVNALAVLPGGCLASAGEDARIAIWCGAETSPKRVLTGHQAPIAALAVSPDGRWLASASWDRTLRLWSIEAPDREPRIVDGHRGPVVGVAFSSNSDALVSAGYDGQVRLTPLDANRAALSFEVAIPINAVAVAGDGEIIAAGADGRVRFLTGDLRLVSEIEVGTGPLTSIAVSPDGAMVSTAGLRTPVTLIDRPKRTISNEILGPGLPVWSLAFATDGDSLFTGGADRAIRRWDPRSARPSGRDLAPPVVAEAVSETDLGARVFRACRACHSLKYGENGLAGPTLHGLFGRRIATAEGYVYSEPLTRMDIVWTPDTVSRLFEVGPSAFTPGTKMPEQRITNPEERRALVEWLEKVTKP